MDAVTDAGNRSGVGVYVFMVTMCTFLLLAAVEIIRTCWKYVPAMTSRMFRAGFGSVALGCAFAVIALTAKIARQTIVLLGIDMSWDSFLQGRVGVQPELHCPVRRLRAVPAGGVGAGRPASR